MGNLQIKADDALSISDRLRQKYLNTQDQNCPIISATDEDFHSCYIMKHIAGDGTSAIVHFATDVRNGRKVAVKVIRKNGLDRETAARISSELSAWRKVQHPNICQLYEVFNTSTCYYFVCEPAENGDLLEYINNHGFFKETQARQLFIQLLSAIEHCHDLGIVHRDLKLENVLLDAEGNIKLTDFGFAGFFDVESDNRLHEWCGSPPYAAPEIFLGKPYVGPEVDVWSLGVVLFAVCSGTLPFHGDAFDLLMKQVVRAKFEIPFFMSMGCESLIRSMLELNPDKRIAVSAIHNHSWVSADDYVKPTPAKPPPPSKDSHKQQQRYNNNSNNNDNSDTTTNNNTINKTTNNSNNNNTNNNNTNNNNTTTTTNNNNTDDDGGDSLSTESRRQLFSDHREHDGSQDSGIDSGSSSSSSSSSTTSSTAPTTTTSPTPTPTTILTSTTSPPPIISTTSTSTSSTTSTTIPLTTTTPLTTSTTATTTSATTTETTTTSTKAATPLLVSSNLLLFDCPMCKTPASARWDFETKKETVCSACEELNNNNNTDNDNTNNDNDNNKKNNDTDADNDDDDNNNNNNKTDDDDHNNTNANDDNNNNNNNNNAAIDLFATTTTANNNITTANTSTNTVTNDKSPHMNTDGCDPDMNTDE